jgi:hypothetical protein
MVRLWALSLLAAATLAATACSGEEEVTTTITPPPTPASLLRNVPANEIDGSTGSEKFEAAPAGASPAVGLEAAMSKVSAQAQGADVLEMVLLNQIDLLNDPPDPPKLVWVGNLDPGEYPVEIFGPSCHPETCAPRGTPHTLYAYVVIDATTGEFLHSASSAYFETATPEP